MLGGGAGHSCLTSTAASRWFILRLRGSYASGSRGKRQLFRRRLIRRSAARARRHGEADVWIVQAADVITESLPARSV
jgi:hypothetical protein